MGEEVDHFAALGLPRRASLDADRIRSAFQDAGRANHPDTGGDADAFEAVNRAQSALLDPAQRLKHLAELEFGRIPDAGGAVDGGTMSLFETVGAALATADDFLKRRASASSAIAKALLAKSETEASTTTFLANGAVRARRAEELERLEGIDAALATGARDQAWAELGVCSRALSFLGKWEAQLGERMAELVAGG